MPAKAPPEAPPARSGPPATPPAADVRSSRIYLFSRGPLQAVLRRTLSIGALVVLDVVGLALGLYLALVLRQLVYGEEEIFWSLLWTQGPGVAQVPRADHGARLPAGRPLRAARAPRRAPGGVVGSHRRSWR